MEGSGNGGQSMENVSKMVPDRQESMGKVMGPEVFVIHGPPGTGKTTTLVKAWIPDAVKAHGSDGVVVCSFTKAASIEIQQRLEADGVELPSNQVGTLHSLCFGALGFPKLAVNREARKSWDEVALPEHRTSGRVWKATAASLEERLSVDGDSPGDRLHSQMELDRARLIESQGEVLEFRQAWQRWKTEEGLLDFTDLIERAPPVCPRSPAVLFVDEAQDYSALDMRVIRQWAESCTYVVLAGDPNQAIYEFRGCEPGLMMKMVSKPENVRELKRSWRVPQTVQGRAEDLLRLAADAYPVEYQARVDERTGAPVAGCVEQRSGTLAVEAQLALEETEGTVMLLAQARYLLPLLQLKAAGVPYHNPYAASDYALNPLRGGAARLAKLLNPISPGQGRSARLWTWGELNQWLEPMVQPGNLVRGAKQRVKRLATKDSTRSVPIRADELPHVFEDVESLQEAAAASRVGDLISWWATRLLASQQHYFEYALTLARMDTRLLTDQPRLIVGTIHSVKGGEADTVIVSSDISRAAKEEDELCPGRLVRLFYVAMTRAKSRLLVAEPVTRCCYPPLLI